MSQNKLWFSDQLTIHTCPDRMKRSSAQGLGRRSSPASAVSINICFYEWKVGSLEKLLPMWTLACLGGRYEHSPLRFAQVHTQGQRPLTTLNLFARSYPSSVCHDLAPRSSLHADFFVFYSPSFARNLSFFLPFSFFFLFFFFFFVTNRVRLIVLHFVLHKYRSLIDAREIGFRFGLGLTFGLEILNCIIYWVFHVTLSSRMFRLFLEMLKKFSDKNCMVWSTILIRLIS